MADPLVPRPRPPAGRALRGLAALALAAWVASLAAWAGHVAGRPWPAGLARTALLAALAASIATAAGAVARGLADGRRRRATLALAAVLAAALAVRFAGLDYEIAERPYLDEATYHFHAREIDGGAWLRTSFIYPHLLYYADAFALWGVELFHEELAGGLARWPGLGEWVEVEWLAMRSLVALAGSLAAVAAFVAAGAVAGPGAAVLGGLLAAFSPLFNEGSHLAIADVPAASLAAVSFAAAALLLHRERWRWYLVAGAAAGLAAATKYPAGLVAVSVAAVWLRHRLATRRWSWHLAAAALAAILAFLAVMPSLVAFPDEALHGEEDLFFGARQHGRRSWIGVARESRAGYYGDLLRANFGWAALALGVTGFWRLAPSERRRLLWLLPFVVLYGALVATMAMAVKRNLYPVLPPLAALLGAGAAGWLPRPAPRGEAAAAVRPRWRIAAAVALGLVLLAAPAWRTVSAAVAMARPSTREAALAWVVDNLPPGAAILRESYAPDPSPHEWAVWKGRFAARFPLPELRRGGVDYLILSSAAYGRFLDPAARTRAHHAVHAAWYERVFAELPLLREVVPGPLRLGPVNRVYRLPPEGPPGDSRHFAAPDDFFVSEEAMRGDGAVVVTGAAQWSGVKADLVPGSYRLLLHGSGLAGGRVEAFDARAEALATRRLARGTARGLVVPTADRVFLRLSLPPGARVTGAELVPET